MTGGYLDPQFMAGKCDYSANTPQFMAKLKRKMMIIITIDSNILQMQKKETITIKHRSSTLRVIHMVIPMVIGL